MIMVVVKFLVFVSEVVSIFSKILTWIIGGERIPLPHQLNYWGARAPAAPLSLRLCISLCFAKIIIFPCFQKCPLLFSKNSTAFYILSVYFLSPYFDRPAFMHHPMHVLDAPGVINRIMWTPSVPITIHF